MLLKCYYKCKDIESAEIILNSLNLMAKTQQPYPEVLTYHFTSNIIDKTLLEFTEIYVTNKCFFEHGNNPEWLKAYTESFGLQIGENKEFITCSNMLEDKVTQICDYFTSKYPLFKYYINPGLIENPENCLLFKFKCSKFLSKEFFKKENKNLISLFNYQCDEYFECFGISRNEEELFEHFNKFKELYKSILIDNIIEIFFKNELINENLINKINEIWTDIYKRNDYKGYIRYGDFFFN